MLCLLALNAISQEAEQETPTRINRHRLEASSSTAAASRQETIDNLVHKLFFLQVRSNIFLNN